MKTFSSSRRRRPRSTPGQRAEWVRRFEQSGLSQRQFAERHGLGLFALRQWIGRSRKGTAGAVRPVWRELKLNGLPGVTCWAAEVVRPDGWAVRVVHNAPARLVEALLRVR